MLNVCPPRSLMHIMNMQIKSEFTDLSHLRVQSTHVFQNPTLYLTTPPLNSNDSKSGCKGVTWRINRSE